MRSRIAVAGADFGFNLVCSGYMVEDEKVLLVHHNRFDKWVPPGGHIEAGETFAEAAEREFQEETGIYVDVVGAGSEIHPADSNACALPLPFYTDLELEGFAVPTIVQFYYVRRRAERRDEVVPQISEVHAARFFSISELSELQTFDQVRSVATYALRHHPDATR
ncbi:NUDIX domain-containing protein [Cellulomonas sp. PS-H5]|uniref:NUDIX domain-containing protein n=1 Tax=Cellulomonas sp. PS-H5 TaxID=2820400 RepID=UPI001C4E9D96|nr:NUDIX domain-containing protein [Cellulomonas sp. PS-H5]MBW0252589.1 NUDIX domain-containing protein [Cellulomonas sp. PS-H5]